MTIILTTGAVSLLIWIVLLAARGEFWLLKEQFETVRLSGEQMNWPSVMAIVPARNEALLIGEAVSSLAGQDYPGAFTITVVDDQSSDDTAGIARRIRDGHPVDVIQGSGPVNGWTGKIWAMQQGLTHADLAVKPDYLLFVDADIALKPSILRRLVVLAEAKKLVLTSLMVKLRCESAAERWLVPAFIFFFRMLYPFAWVNDPRRATAAAAGGCMLVRREPLVKAGGFAPLRGALIDDCALGAQMKRQGPTWLGVTSDALSLRPYPDFADFAQMVMRSAYAELRYSILRLAFTVVAMSVVFLVPPFLTVFARGLPQALGVAAWAIMALLFAPTLRFYGQSWLRGLALPFIATVYMMFTLGSAVQYWRGRGGQWKGRIQAPATKSQRA